MSRYVVVPFEAFDARLRAAGFKPLEGDVPGDLRTWEVVYERWVEETSLFIRVFSAYPRRASASGARAQRERGSDAIRVALVHVGNTDRNRVLVRGLRKYPRVHRAGSAEAVVERVLERARGAWVDGRKFGPDCPRCGGPSLRSRGCFFRCGGPLPGLHPPLR